MDIADQAQKEEALSLSLSLAKRNDTLLPTGSCHYCDALVGEQALFCDSDCRDDYEREQRVKSQRSIA